MVPKNASEGAADKIIYHFKVHKEGNRFCAQCIELEGCVTQADAEEQLLENMEEALDHYVQESADKDLVALPDESISPSRGIVEVQLDPLIALSFMVRYHRIKNGLTQQEAANKFGKSLPSYQRLENKPCNHRFEILFQIWKVFPDFSVNLLYDPHSPVACRLLGRKPPTLARQ